MIVVSSGVSATPSAPRSSPNGGPKLVTSGAGGESMSVSHFYYYSASVLTLLRTVEEGQDLFCRSNGSLVDLAMLKVYLRSRWSW